MLEGYTSLGFLAGQTSSLELGLLVTGVTYRHPGLLAKIVTTLDVLSGGRAMLGIGAAWYDREHRGLGVPFPPTAERFERLEETLQICRQMFRGERGHVRGHGTTSSPRPPTCPRPLRPGGPRILVGGSGERKTLRLVAQYADACNLFGLRARRDAPQGRGARPALRRPRARPGRGQQDGPRTAATRSQTPTRSSAQRGLRGPGDRAGLGDAAGRRPARLGHPAVRRGPPAARRGRLMAGSDDALLEQGTRLGRPGPRPGDPGRARGAHRGTATWTSWPTGSTAPSSSAPPACAGALGAGPNRMNRVVVLRAAAGLAAYLRDDAGRRRAGSVVIGYDARHNSDVFARDTAEVMTGAGLRAYVLPRPLPTPVLAFAIRDLGCAAGVMVTASHNPPQDNGYKVYLGDGSQIVPPADAEIAARIAAGRRGRRPDPARRRRARSLGDDAARPLPRRASSRSPAAARATCDVVYTPLHGVGGSRWSPRAASAAGFPEPHVVADAGRARPRLPDRRRSPTPRSRARWTSRWRWPRRSAPTSWSPTTPTPTGARWRCPGPHGWQMLRGDEVGALLADHLLRLRREGVYATTIVSSSLLGQLAGAEQQLYVETLTGFKWIGRVPRPRVRLRGGARLLRRPRAREGQGRRSPRC